MQRKIEKKIRFSSNRKFLPKELGLTIFRNIFSGSVPNHLYNQTDPTAVEKILQTRNLNLINKK